MVNMNAADDKQSVKPKSQTKHVTDEEVPCSSGACTEKIIDQNERSPSKLEYNVNSITNGAYPKTNATPHNNSELFANDEPPGIIKVSAQNSCKKSNGYQVSHKETETPLLLNNSECHEGSSNCCVNRKLQINSTKKIEYNYDISSSSEDEECCIYTYKGDVNQMADLPRSFFRLDLRPSKPNTNSGNSSPDMDYLEMDFDPGPSNDRDSCSDSDCSEGRANERFNAELPSVPQPSSYDLNARDTEGEPTSISPLSTPSPVFPPRVQGNTEQPSSSAASLKTPTSSPQRPTSVQDIENRSFLPPSFCYCISSKLSPISIDENFNEGDASSMIWKENEAREKQVTQIATSACGATAVINTLLGLNVQFSVSAVKQIVATRLRSETAPVNEYLLSRCHAGATHEDIIRGIQGASQDLVYARFFHMYPQRSISLTNWLSHWIRKGAVPILTRNLQRGLSQGAEMPDCWHHQMVYGVSAQGVHLTNPLETLSEHRLWPQLASPSVLKVRRDDVLSRFTSDTPLHHLAHPSLPLWRKMNVLGQVVNIIREDISCQHTSHVTIPASYCSGVILAILRTNPAYEDLRLAPELPIDPFASS